MKVSRQEIYIFTPPYPICFLISIFVFPYPLSLAFFPFIYIVQFPILIHIHFYKYIHLLQYCTPHIFHMQTQQVENYIYPVLFFCILLLLLALPLVHNSHCQIFLDVDSNVDVGTDDSEEGICNKRTPTRMHDCSKVID